MKLTIGQKFSHNDENNGNKYIVTRLKENKVECINKLEIDLEENKQNKIVFNINDITPDNTNSRKIRSGY